MIGPAGPSGSACAVAAFSRGRLWISPPRELPCRQALRRSPAGEFGYLTVLQAPLPFPAYLVC